MYLLLFLLFVPFNLSGYIAKSKNLRKGVFAFPLHTMETLKKTSFFLWVSTVKPTVLLSMPKGFHPSGLPKYQTANSLPNIKKAAFRQLNFYYSAIYKDLFFTFRCSGLRLIGVTFIRLLVFNNSCKFQNFILRRFNLLEKFIN